MNNTGADIAISTLGKLIDQELAAMRAASRDGNRPLYEISSTRYHAYLTAKDEITKALADAVEERDAGNPFLPQRDELVTMDIHTCDLCGPVVLESRLQRVPVLRRPGQGGGRGVRRLHVASQIPSGKNHFAECLPSFRAVAPVPIGD